MWLNLQQTINAFKRRHPHTSRPAGPRRPGRVIRSSRGVAYFLAWLSWILLGTFFYAYMPDSNLGFVKGFYMAINIGYSIGWGDISENNPNYFWFSSIYVLMGASFVALALGFFASRIVEDTDNWFTNLQQEEEHRKKIAKDMPFYTRFAAKVKYHWEAVRAILLWVLWIVIMIVYSLVQIKWPINTAQYFAISSLSTGGHMSIPPPKDGTFGQPDWIYGLTGLMCATGIPLMAVAMSSIASLMIDSGDLDDMKKTMKQEVTVEEIEMLQRFGLEDGDGEIDRAEFIILCMLRVGADPELISFISDRFKDLDDNKDGSLALHEITRGKHAKMPTNGTDDLTASTVEPTSPCSSFDIESPSPTILRKSLRTASAPLQAPSPKPLSNVGECQGKARPEPSSHCASGDLDIGHNQEEAMVPENQFDS